MTKEIQDLAWSVFPKEFKKEVNKLYFYYSRMAKDQYDCGIMDCIETIFGKHNLTSDVEEEEMLTVSRKRVQNIYAQCEKIEMDDSPNLPAETVDAASTKMALLTSLFGSKCLPDEEPKPAEPKFKVGDIASYVCSPTLKHKCTITEAIKMSIAASGSIMLCLNGESRESGFQSPTSNPTPSRKSRLVHGLVQMIVQVSIKSHLSIYRKNPQIAINATTAGCISRRWRCKEYSAMLIG